MAKSAAEREKAAKLELLQRQRDAVRARIADIRAACHKCGRDSLCGQHAPEVIEMCLAPWMYIVLPPKPKKVKRG